MRDAGRHRNSRNSSSTDQRIDRGLADLAHQLCQEDTTRGCDNECDYTHHEDPNRLEGEEIRRPCVGVHRNAEHDGHDIDHGRLFGMRRAAVTRLNVNDTDEIRRAVSVPDKGGLTHRYQISRQGLKAIADYIEQERINDADCWTESKYTCILGSNAYWHCPKRFSPLRPLCSLFTRPGRCPVRVVLIGASQRVF